MRSTAGVCQGTVLTGAVVANGMDVDELFAHGDLHGPVDDGHLDLTSAEGVADPVSGAGKADVAGAVDLAGH